MTFHNFVATFHNFVATKNKEKGSKSLLRKLKTMLRQTMRKIPEEKLEECCDKAKNRRKKECHDIENFVATNLAQQCKARKECRDI